MLLHLDAGRVFGPSWAVAYAVIWNPCDLLRSDSAAGGGGLQPHHGAVENYNPENTRFGCFAVSALLGAAYTGFTVSQATAKWAPPTDKAELPPLIRFTHWTAQQSFDQC